ncbi:hypothetical protein DRN44_04105 [Thermococci archaeon]|nr:MAG: hypothetical protein DRN44_04105 [Thermococci archaeon]
MLTKMLIENYKSIKKAELEFSKINVLVGPNGSGKTSILECAEVLGNPHVYARSITSSVIGGVLLENLLNIRFFDEIVHAHDISKTIHINANFKDVGILRVEVSLSKEKGTRKLTGNSSSNRDLKMELSRVLHILKTNRRVGRRLGGVLADTFAVNTSNSHAVFYYACYRSEFQENIGIIREFYTKYGLQNLRWVPTETQGQYEIIATTSEGVDINLADAGAGLNALFPIVTALAFYPKRSTIFIEHPEMHLHPKLQYELAEFFLMVSKRRDYQLIIETHSEHLLYGLLNAVASKRLLPEELVVYSSRKEQGESVFKRLIVHEDGSVEGGLQDFLEADIDAFLDWLKA